jgi:hypothetical protein
MRRPKSNFSGQAPGWRLGVGARSRPSVQRKRILLPRLPPPVDISVSPASRRADRRWKRCLLTSAGGEGRLQHREVPAFAASGVCIEQTDQVMHSVNSEYSYKRAGCSVGPFAEKKDGYESFSVRAPFHFGSGPTLTASTRSTTTGYSETTP